MTDTNKGIAKRSLGVVRALPKLADLHKDPAQAFKNDELKLLLNQPPSEKWLAKGAPGVPSSWRDLPIDKVEMLLDMIFQRWRVEVLQTQLILNAVQVTIRLHYWNPVVGEWDFHDGIGAKSVQMDKAAEMGDLRSVKDAGVQMAAPAAKSYAIKDAADHLGELFGRSLNRKNRTEFNPKYNAESIPGAGAEKSENKETTSSHKNYDL